MSEDIKNRLLIRVAELTAEILEIELRLDRLRRERNAIAHAHDALDDIYSGEQSSKLGSPDDALTYKQSVLLDVVPVDFVNRLSPSEIGRACPTLDSGYVRTTLRRMAQTGEVKNKDGTYWKPAP